MSNLAIGVFNDSDAAGKAVAVLKEKGFTDEMSVVSKKMDGMNIDEKTHKVKHDVKDGAGAGAATGAVVGGLGALLAGLTAVAVPGVGVVITGAIATAVVGAAGGAVVGGLAGALIDYGVDETNAKQYEDLVKAGQVLVSVEVEEGHENDVVNIMEKHGITELNVINK